MSKRRDGMTEVLVCLSDGQWWSEKQLRATTGLSASVVSTHVQALRRFPRPDGMIERTHRRGISQWRVKHEHLYPFNTFVERMRKQVY